MPDIIHRIGIKAEPGKVFAALTTEKGLAGWWTKNTKADAKVGATLQFRFSEGGPDMKVVELKPNRNVKWKCVSGPEEWVGTDLTFDLKEEDGETVLLFGHRNWKEAGEFMAHCSCKWAYFLLSLKSLL
jgi:uncharacterized protein YndB with AHSA1/START domain